MNSKSPLQTVMNQSKVRREIYSKSNKIPSLPEVVTEVLRLLNDPGSEIQQFEDVLGKDPALVAKMLRVVNSPFYGLARPMTSIKEAVMVLGFRSLRSLVLAASTAGFMERDYSCYGHDEKGLWKHALSVASGARTLAKILRENPDSREEIFVAGLLHDIGKMLIAPYLGQVSLNTTEGDRDFVDIEDKILGITHEEAGGLVCTKWGLTPLVIDVIKGHHGHCEAEENLRPLTIVRIADEFAHELGHGFRDSFHFKEQDPSRDLEFLGLDNDAFADAKIDMEEAMSSAIATLGNLGA